MSELSKDALDGGHFAGQQIDLPNATAVLVLGICSIVFSFCYGVPGLVCGIVGLVMSNKPIKEYKMNPGRFKDSSYKNMNAGRICSIVGLSISGLFFLGILAYVMFIGAIFGGMSGAF